MLPLEDEQRSCSVRLFTIHLLPYFLNMDVTEEGCIVRRFMDVEAKRLLERIYGYEADVEERLEQN